MTNNLDRGAWYIEGKTVYINIPRLLTYLKLSDTPENRDLVVEIIQEVAAVELPGVPLAVMRTGG